MIISRLYRWTKPFHEQTSPIVWPLPDRYATTQRIASDALPGFGGTGICSSGILYYGPDRDDRHPVWAS